MGLSIGKLLYPTNLSYNFTLSSSQIYSTQHGLKTVRIMLFFICIVLIEQTHFKKRDNMLLK